MQFKIIVNLVKFLNITDHTILDRVNAYYGISELALGWFKSYLLGRAHSVKVGSKVSHPAVLHYGVPQGSVLGPILFSLCTNPIGSIIHAHSSINYHFYADDTQLYIKDIQYFMFGNELKLYPDKPSLFL